MPVTVDPFAELVRVVSRPRALEPITGAENKTAALFDCLRQGNYTTPELGAACGLSSRQVWGLLRAPLESGRVVRIGDAWAINHEWRSQQVVQAAALLRAHGWEVKAPQ